MANRQIILLVVLSGCGGPTQITITGDPYSGAAREATETFADAVSGEYRRVIDDLADVGLSETFTGNLHAIAKDCDGNDLGCYDRERREIFIRTTGSECHDLGHILAHELTHAMAEGKGIDTSGHPYPWFQQPGVSLYDHGSIDTYEFRGKRAITTYLVCVDDPYAQ